MRRVDAGALAVAVAACALLAATAPAASAAGPSASARPTWSVVAASSGSAPPALTAAAAHGSRLYLAGAFGGVARTTGPLATVDLDAGTVIADSAVEPAETAWEITAAAPHPQGGYYLAGHFSRPGQLTPRDVPVVVRIRADGTVDPGFAPVFQDGAVTALAVGSDGTVYAGGSFTSVGGQGRFGLAAVNGTTGNVRAAFNPQANGSVHRIELAPDSAAATGTMYIAGEFTTVKGSGTTAQPRDGLARVKLSDGGLLAWDPKVKEASVAGRTPVLAATGDTVYIGGEFAPVTPGEATVGTATRSNLAAVDAVSAAVRSWAPEPDGPVYEIEVEGSTIYAGGSFERIGSQSPQPLLRKVAALDAATGRADESWNAGFPADGGSVSHVVPRGDTVYLGGGYGEPVTSASGFTRIQGVARCTLAAVAAPDGTSPELRPWDPAPAATPGRGCVSSQRLTAMDPVAGGLVIGGDFQLANLRARRGLAALDLNTGEALDWAPATNGFASGDVRDLQVSADGATVFLGGRFTSVNGVTAVKNLAAVDADGAASTAAAVRTGWAVPDNEVRALALSPDGATLYLGGTFGKLGTATRSRLAAVATSTGTATATTFRAPNAGVYDLELSPEGTLFAAGAFTSVGGTARAHAAELSTADGTLLPWDPSLPATAEVDDLAVGADTVYVAGLLVNAPADALAALRRTDGTRIDLAAAPDGRVRRVALAPDGTLYLAGMFTRLGATAQSGVGAVAPDGTVTDWRPVGLQAQPSTSRNAPEILFPGDDVVVGGNFNVVSGRARGSIAVFGPATLPGAVAPPQVTGAAEIGKQVRCVPGRWSGSAPFVREWRWERGGAAIVGATGDRYVVTEEDSGAELRCVEQVRNAAGAAEQASPAVTGALDPPLVDVVPVVAGEPFAGREATCSTGLWRNRPTGFRYRWLLDGQPVEGATGQALLLGAGDRNRMLGCEVVAENAAGAGEAARSPVVRITQPPPRAITPPSIFGPALTGSELTCATGNWEDAVSYAFQWQRDGADIAGATADRYRVITADAAHRISCRVTVANDDHTTIADSAGVDIRAGGSTQQRSRQPDTDNADEDLPRRLDVRSARLRGGKLRVTLRAPLAGPVAVQAEIAGKPRPRVVGRARATAEKAGTLILDLTVSKALRRALDKAGRKGVRVTVRASLDRASGKPLKDAAKVRVKGRR